MLSNRQHTVIACILVLTCLYALRLSSIEVQPWDEGLYAIRAQSIVVFGSWMDQSDHALGGLYSATAPPFVPWMMAASMQMFGPSPAAIRIGGVLCSGFALLAFYAVAMRMMSFRSSILAMCALAGSMHWTIYARQGMTEVPLMMFVLTSFWASLKITESHSWKLAIPFVLASGLAFGGALLTKMTVSVVPLFVMVVLVIRRPSSMPLFAGAAVLGLACAAPWYGSMIARHGEQFWYALTIPHLTTEVEANGRALGALYYVNQLVVAHPIILAALAYVVISAFRRSLLSPRTQAAAIIGLAWFVLGMLIFSAAPTKNPHYVVMLLPPAVLISLYALERWFETGSRRTVAVLYGCIASATAWSLLPGTRTALRAMTFDAATIGVVLLLVAMVVIPFVLSPRRVAALSVRGFRPVIYGTCAVMIFRTVSLIAIHPQPVVEGGKEVALELLDAQVHAFGYLYHQHNAGDAFDPQLAWYTTGWMAGWIPGKTYTPFAMPAHATDGSMMAVAAASGLPYIVYQHTSADSTMVQDVRAHMAASYDVVALRAPHYTLFKRR